MPCKRSTAQAQRRSRKISEAPAWTSWQAQTVPALDEARRHQQEQTQHGELPPWPQLGAQPGSAASALQERVQDQTASSTPGWPSTGWTACKALWKPHPHRARLGGCAGERRAARAAWAALEVGAPGDACALLWMTHHRHKLAFFSPAAQPLRHSVPASHFAAPWPTCCALPDPALRTVHAALAARLLTPRPPWKQALAQRE
jgi:hypothetical protein